MNKANRNNEAKYICLLCIQLYKLTLLAMALFGCKRSSHTGPHLRDIALPGLPDKKAKHFCVS